MDLDAIPEVPNCPPNTPMQFQINHAEFKVSDKGYRYAFMLCKSTTNPNTKSVRAMIGFPDPENDDAEQMANKASMIRACLAKTNSMDLYAVNPATGRKEWNVAGMKGRIFTASCVIKKDQNGMPEAQINWFD